MAQSQLALYNTALSHVGAAHTVLDTASTAPPVAACNLHYDNVRQTILRAAHWNCAKRHKRLVQQAEYDGSSAWAAGDPDPGYRFSYDFPDDMLAARYMVDFSRFTLGHDGTQPIINSNIGGDDADDAPVLVYTIDVTDPSKWEPDLYQAIAFGLAAHISMGLTGKIQRTRGLLDFANSLLLEARANTANEREAEIRATSEALQNRGHPLQVVSPYVYPYGHLMNVGGVVNV